MRNAIFTVTCPKSNEVVKQYELEYETLQGLEADFLESRQVWSEYMVTVDADECHLSAPLTWREEVCIGQVAELVDAK